MEIGTQEMERSNSDNDNNNNNNNSNNNGNNHNGDQTLDHHIHYVAQRQTSKSPLPGSNPKPIRYRECLKNHAASIGGSVYDGCGEFMPSAEDGSIEALKCAACNCHRNFHRKELDGRGGSGGPHYHHHHQHGGGSGRRPVVNMVLNSLQLPPPAGFPLHHHQQHHQKYGGMHLSPPQQSGMVTPMSVAYGGGGANTESSSEDLNMYGQSSADVQQPPPLQPPFSLTKKRFRTKFTAEQKVRMLGFAEKLGWRMNKQDEEELERFCAEIGVKRQVFKVWMHNNKNNVKKQQPL